MFIEHTEVNPAGAILAMGKLYFQMDDRLREVWRPILGPLIERAARACGGQLGWIEPFLAMDGMSGENEGPEWERWKVEEKGSLWAEPAILKINGREPVTGWGADRFEQILHEEAKIERVNYGEETEEYLRKKYWIELKPKPKIDKEEKPVKAEKTAIEILHEAGIKLTAEDRLHPEAAELVRAVEKDPEAGDLDKMGALKLVAERLTGRKIEDLDITQTIMALGQIKKTGQEMAGANRNVAEALVFEAQAGENSFWYMDLTTKMMVILRAGNRLPKALIVEQLIQSLGGGAEVAMMRVALAVEKLIREQRPWETGEEQFVFPVFTGRDRLEKARAEYGADSVKYRRETLRTFAEFLGVTQIYHDYEGSVTDWLTFMDVLEETGRPMSQCGELAQFAAEMQRWMVPDVKTNTAYRERFTGLNLEEWMDKLKRGEAEGTFDHVKVVTTLPHHGEMIIDETTGKAHVTNGKVMTRNERRSRVMDRGEYRRVEGGVAEMDYVGREAGREEVDEGLLIYDSKSKLKDGPRPHFLGEIASTYPELKSYALAMAGDDPVVLGNLQKNTKNIGEKLRYLRKIMAMAPRQIADGFGEGEIGHQKSLIKDAGMLIKAGDYCQGIFILQVLERKYGGISFGGEIERLHGSVINRLAVMSKEELAKNINLAKGDGLLLAEDEEAIKKAWEKHQLEIERLAKEKGIDEEAARREIAESVKMVMSSSIRRAETAAIRKVDNYVPEGMGYRKKAEIKEEVRQAAVEYRNDHQIERADANLSLRNGFVELDPNGAGFAIAEITRGLTPEQIREALTGVGVFLLAAEKDLGFSELPDGVENLWNSVTAAVKARGLAMPFTRAELIANLPAVMVRLRSEGMMARLLTSKGD